MISKHISFDEATVSNTATRFGIENNPSDIQLACMKLVAEKCFEPLRTWYNKPIKVNSFFRCESLNAKVGGSKTSQHVKGEAIDISGGNKEENKKLFDWCKDNLEFDQLINEYDFTWVHISYTVKNRKQILAIK
jgi:zinc D-Ala-D-Ala carboxypeptidase